MKKTTTFRRIQAPGIVATLKDLGYQYLVLMDAIPANTPGVYDAFSDSVAYEVVPSRIKPEYVGQYIKCWPIDAHLGKKLAGEWRQDLYMRDSYFSDIVMPSLFA